MSTEHDIDALEYGPTPHGAQYEHTDINPAIGYNFAIWLFVAMIMSVGLVYGTFWFFERQAVATDAATPAIDSAVRQGRRSMLRRIMRSPGPMPPMPSRSTRVRR